MNTTVDAFLGGTLHIEQPLTGYRAGIDPVLLAAACPAKTGETLLDLGCGVGTAGLCVAARCGVALFGVELNPSYAALAGQNGQRNGVQCTIETADVMARPTPFSDHSFHHVITNPPYFPDQPPSHNPDKAMGRSGALDYTLWFETAYKRLRPKGSLTVIYRTERLPDVLMACHKFGAMELRPITPRSGKPAKLFILRAVKDSKTPFKLLPPLVLHNGAQHEQDAESYTPAIQAVLRNGAPLPWSD